MCILALAPAAPILAPFAVMYFLVCTPLLRYAVIFTYKPQWDAGGTRWPFLADMIISSLMASQVLLTTMMALKRAAGPATLACLLSIPTFVFRQTCRKRFLGAYNDAALLQTSLLDGWDTTEKTTMREREEFRRFLIDSHKAAYVPACIAGTNTDRIITAEPAVVVQSPTDVDVSALTFVSDDQLPPCVAELSTSSPVFGTYPTTCSTETSAANGATIEERQASSSFAKSQQAGAVMRRGSIAFVPSAINGQQVLVGSNTSTTEPTASVTSSRISNFGLPSLGLMRQGTRGKKE